MIRLIHIFALLVAFNALGQPEFLPRVVVGGILQSPIPTERLIDWTNYVGVENKPTGRTVYTNLPLVTAATINTAIQNCPSNQIVTLTNQPYQTETAIVMKSGVTLRGQGTNTVIIPTNGNSAITLAPTASYTSVSITSGAWRGSTNIVVASSISDANVDAQCFVTATNDWSFVYPFGLEGGTPTTWAGDDPDSPTGNRLRSDVSRIYSVAGTAVTLKHPLTFDYTNTPATFKYIATGSTQPIRMAGIENLALNATNYGIVFDNAVNCWSSNVLTRIFGGDTPTCFGYFSVQSIHIQHCGFDGFNSRASAIVVRNDSANWLIENNWFNNVYQAVVFVSRGNTHVVLGNFNASTSDGTAEFVTHGGHKQFVYWAHNRGIGLRFDLIHGSSSHQVVFRNHFLGTSGARNYGPIWTDQYNYSNSFAGNVLGYSGMTGYQYEQSSPASWTQSIFSWEYNGFDTTDAGGRHAKDSAVVHNNVSYESGSAVIRTDSTRSTTLTNCYYYGTARPSWWGTNLAWPAIGPDVSGYTNMIPSQVRFFYGTNSF